MKKATEKATANKPTRQQVSKATRQQGSPRKGKCKGEGKGKGKEEANENERDLDHK